MTYKLTKPTIFYKKKYYEYLKQWNDEVITPTISDLRGRRYETLLKELYELEHEVEVPKGYFPEGNYLFVDENEDIIGFVNIRHHLNKLLLNTRGNISFGIKPSERKPEVTQALIDLSLHQAREMGIQKIKLVCQKEDNQLCQHIIDIGGALESEDFNDVDHYYIQRFWINL